MSGLPLARGAGERIDDVRVHLGGPAFVSVAAAARLRDVRQLVGNGAEVLHSDDAAETGREPARVLEFTVGRELVVDEH